MKVIGVAGGSGTGKSMIAAHLEAGGAGHIDADRVGHEVLDEEAVRERLVAAFGRGIVEGGRVSRVSLARLVFGDPSKLERLNSIVHPRIIEVCRERIAHFKERGCRLVVVDAALLLEVPVTFEIDLMIALQASRDERVRRLVARGDGSVAEIEARLRSQEHLEDAFDRADAIVNTDAPKTVVLEQVDRLVATLLDQN